MAVTLKTTRGKGTFKGLNSNIEGYKVVEDATPRIAGDSSGGVGSINATVIENAGTILFSGNEIEVEDTSISTVRGIVRNIDLNNSVAALTADTLMAKLTVSRDAAPFHGTLQAGIAYYLSLAGITTGFTVAAAFANRQIVIPGFYDNIWTFLKQLAVVHRFEIATVANVIVFREMHLRKGEPNPNLSGVSLSVDTDSIALTAGVYCYNTSWVQANKVWPDDPAATVLEVAPGETIVQSIKTNVSLESIMAPIAVSPADQLAYSGSPRSYYFVHDGVNALTPSQWSEMGGYLSVEISEDDRTQIIVTVRGGNDPTVTSYHIAAGVSDGEEGVNFSNGLYIVGTGVRTDKELITVQTGADPIYVTEDSAPTVDNICIQTKAQAYTAAAQVAAAHAGPALSLTLKTNRMKVAGTNGIFGAPKFGEIAGTRVANHDTQFRIKSVTATASGLDTTAERDTMIEDFNTVWAGASFDDFNDVWVGKTFDEFSVAPLRRN